MKEFNKNKEDLFICEECNVLHKNKGELSKHINRKHFNSQIYYDKWILELTEDKCKICGKKAKYIGGLLGYENFCSRKCAIEYNTHQRKKFNLEKFGSISPFGNKKVIEKSKQTMLKKYGNEHFTNPEKIKETSLKKYGVSNPSKAKHIIKKIKETHLKNYGIEYPMQVNKTKEKSKETCLKKYGVEYSLQSKNNKEKAKQTMLKKYGVEYSAQNEEIYNKVITTKKEKYGEDFNKKFRQKSKQTMLKKYGNENYNNREKYKETCLEKYGENSYFETNEFKNKFKKICLEKYGVEHISQNQEIHEKIQKSCFRIKRFRDTNIWYQGSYELDFLEKYYDKYPDIVRGPRIKYEFKGKTRYYFSDFYIPSLNLIVEIKNSYLAKKDKLKIDIKRKETIKNGYKWVMIIDKKYDMKL